MEETMATGDADVTDLLKEIGDQIQYTTHKIEVLSNQIHNLMTITTVAECLAAVALIVAAIAIRLAYRAIVSQRHKYPMPKELVLPRLEPPVEAKDFNPHIPDKGRVDTLAELARALNVEGFRT
jgi:hypothetical protein